MDPFLDSEVEMFLPIIGTHASKNDYQNMAYKWGPTHSELDYQYEYGYTDIINDHHHTQI